MAIETKHKFASVIVTDFETGGKDPSKVAMTEVAMIGIRLDTLEEIGRYQSLIAPYPGFAYEEEAEKITGITQDLLEAEGKSLEQVAKEVLTFVNSCNISKSTTGWKPIIVAHNASYEVQCFQHMFHVTKMLKEFEKQFHGSKDFYGNFQPHTIDTIDIAKELWSHNQRMTSFALGPVAERAAIELVDAHRAMNDAITTTQFFIDTVRGMRSSEGVINSEGSKSYRDTFKFFQF